MGQKPVHNEWKITCDTPKCNAECSFSADDFSPDRPASYAWWVASVQILFIAPSGEN